MNITNFSLNESGRDTSKQINERTEVQLSQKVLSKTKENILPSTEKSKKKWSVKPNSKIYLSSFTRIIGGNN